MPTARGIHDESPARFRHVVFVPTYESQVVETAPAALAALFREELSFSRFCWVLDRLLNTQGLDHVFFRGGEPTLWTDLDRAIYYARQHDIGTTLQTNGIQKTKKSLPDDVVVSLHAYIDYPEHRAAIRQTIVDYHALRVPISLVYFRRSHDDTKDITSILSELTDITTLSCQTRRGYFEMSVSCKTCPYTHPIVQPDGDTVSFCKFLSQTASLSEYLTLSDLHESLRSQMAGVSPACKKSPRVFA